MNCEIKLLTETAKIPCYAHDGDIGADIFSDCELIIQKGKRALVSTGFSLACSSQMRGYFRVAPRSGLSVKGIDVGAGVIDLSYRGECKILLINNSENDFTIKRGDKIAQLILEKAEIASFIKVENLTDTSRGNQGFGSTGI